MHYLCMFYTLFMQQSPKRAFRPMKSDVSPKLNKFALEMFG